MLEVSGALAAFCSRPAVAPREAGEPVVRPRQLVTQPGTNGSPPGEFVNEGESLAIAIARVSISGGGVGVG
jgi:hypothetical protein